MSRIHYILLSVFLLSVLFCDAQYQSNFTPRKIYQTNSDLDEALSGLLRWEAKNMKKTSWRVDIINHQRQTAMTRMIKSGYFIDDDTLEDYVGKVAERLISTNGLYANPVRKILVANDPTINAMCYGKGIIVVSIGLLARIESEEQLAFTLAHELAHDELDHVEKKITQTVEAQSDQISKELNKKILLGEASAEDIQEYREVIYDIMNFSRGYEIQADSMALRLLVNAGYDAPRSVSMLDLFEDNALPKYSIGENFFLPFDDPAYPFQEYWLNDRLAVFNKKQQDNIWMKVDSLKTHPDLDVRKKLLKAANIKAQPDHYRLHASDRAIKIAELQVIESAIATLRYDLALYYAMQMCYRYPENAYVTSRIGLIFLNHIERMQVGYSFRRVNTAYSNLEVKLMSNFLLNLELKEMKEVAYHFMKNKDNFNVREKSHYALLWQFCDLTYRNDEKSKLENSYRSNFGKSIKQFELPFEKDRELTSFLKTYAPR